MSFLPMAMALGAAGRTAGDHLNVWDERRRKEEEDRWRNAMMGVFDESNRPLEDVQAEIGTLPAPKDLASMVATRPTIDAPGMVSSTGGGMRVVKSLPKQDQPRSDEVALGSGRFYVPSLSASSIEADRNRKYSREDAETEANRALENARVLAREAAARATDAQNTEFQRGNRANYDLLVRGGFETGEYDPSRSYANAGDLIQERSSKSVANINADADRYRVDNPPPTTARPRNLEEYFRSRIDDPEFRAYVNEQGEMVPGVPPAVAHRMIAQEYLKFFNANDPRALEIVNSAPKDDGADDPDQPGAGEGFLSNMARNAKGFLFGGGEEQPDSAFNMQPNLPGSKTKEQRMAELKKQGVTYEEAIATLRKEGYL